MCPVCSAEMTPGHLGTDEGERMAPWRAEGLNEDHCFCKTFRRQHQERIGFVAPTLNQDRASALYMELLKEDTAVLKAVSLDCMRPCLSQKANVLLQKLNEMQTC